MSDEPWKFFTYTATQAQYLFFFLLYILNLILL